MSAASSAGHFDASDLVAVIRLLKRRSRVVSDYMTQELERSDPQAYEAVYWLVCGVSDYLTAFETEDAQVQWALDLLARVPMESGMEIGELIEARRGAQAKPSTAPSPETEGENRRG